MEESSEDEEEKSSGDDKVPINQITGNNKKERLECINKLC